MQSTDRIFFAILVSSKEIKDKKNNYKKIYK